MQPSLGAWLTNTKPAFGDLDADGDLDLLLGARDGKVHWFDNTGTASEPEFRQLQGAENPLNAVDVDSWSAPALADLDADGDLDLVLEAGDGTVHYWENSGTPSTPDFVEQRFESLHDT